MDKELNNLVEGLSPNLSLADVYSIKNLSKISYVIVKKRLQLDMDQKSFAKLMGVSQTMVSKWESGKYNFTINTISKICSKLDLKFEVNFDDNDAIKNNK